MLNITTEEVSQRKAVEEAKWKKQSLKRYVLEKLRTWINRWKNIRSGRAN